MQPQTRNFFSGKAKHEIARESIKIPRDLLIESLRRDAIERRKVCIQDDLLPANEQNGLLDSFGRNNW